MADKKKYRRSNGEGSIFKHSNGRWCGQIGVGVDENGKRIRKTIFADTRAGVAKELAEMHASVCAHRLKPSNDIRLGHFINKWLRDFKRPEVSLGTYEWYINISKMVSKDVKDTYLNKVNTYQIQNMLNTLKNGGASVRTIKAVYNMLNQIFKAAVEFKMITNNPVGKVKINRKTNHAPKALSADERIHVMKSVEEHPIYKPIIYTMMGMGLRIGEVLALCWEDVDFTGNKVSVSKAAKRTPVIGDSGDIEGHEMAISSTKTARSVRTLPMPQFVRDALWEWKKVYMQRFKASDVADLMFPNKNGQLRSYSGFRRQFERFTKDRGIEKITFHQFRHTFATMMLEQHVNPRVVQEFLGHKDISTTLGIYTGVTSGPMKQAADGVDSAMKDVIERRTKSN
ncbi:MAG: site-specific integrase [Clostridia bacterium]|nr:site-specific integrase [Clostridia bacterium]